MQKLLKAAINYAKYAAYVAKFMAVISSRLVDDVLLLCTYFSSAGLFFLSFYLTHFLVEPKVRDLLHHFTSMTSFYDAMPAKLCTSFAEVWGFIMRLDSGIIFAKVEQVTL